MQKLIKTVLALCLSCCLLILPGCSFGKPAPKPQDSKSLEAVPYTLYGENEYWTASYTISPLEEAEKQKQLEALHTIRDRFGADSTAFRQQQQYSPVCTASFTLAFKGVPEQLGEIKKYTVTFAPGTPYQKTASMQRNSKQAGFEESLLGQIPLFTANFAEDASILGGIPPLDGTYELSVKPNGLKEAAGTLTMQKK